MLPSYIIFAYFSARHFRLLLSHTVVCNILSDATFALCLCTLFSHAKSIHFFVRYFRKHLSNTILQHVIVPCLFARHFRIAFLHVVFSHYFPYATFLASCARYICTPCRTPFPHATPFSQTFSSPSSSNLSPIL